MIVQAKNIVKDYTGHRALNDVSVDIPKGSVYGLLGPNGAGKTTLIRILNRITMPDSGEVIFDGRKMRPDDVLKIGYLPEERGLYKKMKVGEQALYLSRLKGLTRAQALESLRYWFKKFEILGWWDKKVEELSKGMAQKIQFIVTVIHNPDLLIFDEPFSGFDPINANILKEEILDRAKNGATVIFSTHNMSSVEEICDHITLINKSRNVLSGSVQEVREKFAKNAFRMDYIGSFAQIKGGVGHLCAVEEIENQKDGISSVLLKLPVCTPSKAILSAANEVVDIRNFYEKIPSMNEIFIRAVEQTNDGGNL